MLQYYSYIEAILEWLHPNSLRSVGLQLFNKMNRIFIVHSSTRLCPTHLTYFYSFSFSKIPLSISLSITRMSCLYQLNIYFTPKKLLFSGVMDIYGVKKRSKFGYY